MFMVVRRLGLVAGIASVLWPGAVEAAEGDARQTGPEREGPPAVLGVMLDAGVPDGANAALALRPAPWLRLHAGGGTNTVSAGVRGGLTLMIPAVVSPSLNVDLGYYRDGAATALVRSFAGGDGALKPLFERFGYTYVNLQLGLELGRGPVQFFVHGGLSHLSATLHNATEALAASTASRDPSTTVVVREDPVVRVWAPSVKLGFLVLLGAK